jgi:hypothetical protein
MWFCRESGRRKDKVVKGENSFFIATVVVVLWEYCTDERAEW